MTVIFQAFSSVNDRLSKSFGGSSQSHLGRTSGSWEVAAIVRPARDVHILKADVRAAAITAEDVVVPCIAVNGPSDINELDVADRDAVRRITGWPAVEIILVESMLAHLTRKHHQPTAAKRFTHLLHVNPIVLNPAHRDVLVRHIVDHPCRVRIGLDPTPILAVLDDRVLEGHAVDGIVALPADRADGQTVAAVAVEVRDEDVAAACHLGNISRSSPLSDKRTRIGQETYSNAIILIMHPHIPQRHTIRARNIKTVGIMRSGKASAQRIRRIARRVVEVDVLHGQVSCAADVEAVRGPVLDVETADVHVVCLLDDEEVVGSTTSVSLPLGDWCAR